MQVFETGPFDVIGQRERVSIPYSSGEKCKLQWILSSIEEENEGFNPLFIRGKMQEADRL